jgi:hypothetical protein
MGAFFTNYQVRSESPPDAARALARLTAGPAVVSPASGGWVTVYDEPSDAQDLDLLRRTAMGLSRALSTAVFAFLVHDSDVLIYLLYESGGLADEFNSCPDYFGESDEALGGDAPAVLRHCRTGTTVEQVQHLLDPDGGSAFAEQTLEELAYLLGIDPSRATSGFTYFTEADADGPPPDAEQYIKVEGGTPAKPKRSRKPRALPADVEPGGEGTTTIARGLAKELFGAVSLEPYAAAVAMIAYGRSARAGLLRPELYAQLTEAQRAQMEALAAQACASMDKAAAQLLRQSKVGARPTPEALAAAADRGPEALGDVVAGATPGSLDAVAETAIRSGQPALLRAVLDRGARADFTPAGGSTLLGLAAWNGHTGSVEELIARGADVNGRDARGYTPVMHAAQRGNPATVRLLLDRGADPAAAAPDGQTAVSLAKRLGKSDQGISHLLRLALERPGG